jgi:hypothetical protein
MITKYLPDDITVGQIKEIMINEACKRGSVFGLPNPDEYSLKLVGIDYYLKEELPL